MIIKQTGIRRTSATTTLYALCKIRKLGWDRIYFELDNTALDTPARCEYVNDDASPFAAALLLPSMRQGSDLIIEGSLSAKLYDGMHAIMREALRWDIGCRPIRIEAATLVADPPRPQRSASFFSGGVDSFYTYLKHKTDTAKADRIDALILVNGFDINRHNFQLWDRSVKNIRSVAAADNVELLVVRSNIQDLVEPILLWDYSHGGCLAAVGLFLRGGFHQVYIPSTHSVSEQIPWGSNLALDPHWSTEGTTFIHDGTEATRLEKVMSQIARSPLALEHLRVCFANEKGAYNCGRCDKCLRTMINLFVAGALERSGTFPHSIDPDLIAAVPTIPGEHGGIFHTENLRALRERDIAPELQQAISVSMRNAVVMKRDPRQIVEDRVKHLDHVYARGYVYSAWERLVRSRRTSG